MPRGKQLARQWQLVQLLGRPGGLMVDEAARELGCAVRTIWRDLRGLQVVGAALYEGDLRPFWPYLVFGQWTHVGKGATFGLGGYLLERP